MKATTVVARCTTPDGFPMLLQEHDGDFFLKVDGVTLMSTTATASEATLAELGCARGAGRVLIGGLGFGFTLKRVLELVPSHAEIVVAELLPEIPAWNRQHLSEVNGRYLDDPRVQLVIGDVADRIAQASGGGFDAILLDVDNGVDALVAGGNQRLYGRGGLRRIKSALSPRGRVVFWSAHRDKAFEALLEKEFRQVETVGAKAYPQAKRFSHTLFVADR
ncbi:spermidine synthase [Haloferula luteola]|uniref:Spermidine synthase n=1 Tax=Haloferula luteola TaxID=595692 RepID=A0A840UVQ9_9BACT|nr:spermine synthase [Haloferula luteola]MBB5349805.1 spermidine synthase [Haloferula luteola]